MHDRAGLAERPVPPGRPARLRTRDVDMPARARAPRAAAPVLVAMPPLSPGVWARRRRAALPFPLEEPGCRLFARARQGLVHGIRALGMGAGDEVLAPAYHHGSEIEALECAGLTCRFYDVGARLEPDEAALEALLGARTRGLQIVHYLGFPQDADRWRRWCDARGLHLIEDAAHAWLSSIDGRPAGSFGDLSIFCLYKTVGVPDGGALLCRRPAPGPGGRPAVAPFRLALEHALWLVTRSRSLSRLATALHSNRAYDPAADFAIGEPRPASLATRLALPRAADPSVAVRRRANYERLAAGLPAGLVPPAFLAVPPAACPFVLPVGVRDKPRLLADLRRAGIRALDLWSVPHPSLPDVGFPRSAALRRHIVGLPVHQELTARDVDRIAATVRDVAPDPAAL
jgi:dTDP-4-amino-4,6-dideoxygalactose transaminase